MKELQLGHQGCDSRVASAQKCDEKRQNEMHERAKRKESKLWKHGCICYRRREKRSGRDAPGLLLNGCMARRPAKVANSWTSPREEIEGRTGWERDGPGTVILIGD